MSSVVLFSEIKGINRPWGTMTHSGKATQWRGYAKRWQGHDTEAGPCQTVTGPCQTMVGTHGTSAQDPWLRPQVNTNTRSNTCFPCRHGTELCPWNSRIYASIAAGGARYDGARDGHMDRQRHRSAETETETGAETGAETGTICWRAAASSVFRVSQLCSDWSSWSSLSFISSLFSMCLLRIANRYASRQLANAIVCV